MRTMTVVAGATVEAMQAMQAMAVVAEEPVTAGLVVTAA